MSAHPELYVLCMNQRCPHSRVEMPIRLLVPSPPDTKPNPNFWPNDGHFLYVACPECVHVFAYRQAGAAEFSQKKDPGRMWMSISFRCATEGCNTPAEFHALLGTTVTQTANDELREKLASGYWKGVLQCGHPIVVGKKQNVRFEWDLGRMQGYDRSHRKWERI